MTTYRPSASYSITIRVKIPSVPGSFAKVATAIGGAGGDLGSIDIVRSTGDYTIRDITVGAANAEHGNEIVRQTRTVAEVLHVSDRTFLIHLGGKLETKSRVRVEHRDDLSMVYTPGVARICRDIQKNPDHAWNLTMKGRMVMILTDGTRVLGLGDIGPEAALPVMEGKAILFKRFAPTLDAFPICVNTKDADEIVALAKMLAPNFGAINLEDIASPKCFEIERRLNEELDIPVFHDDQHGTAIAILAGLINACRYTERALQDAKIVMIGAGAAGSAAGKLLHAYGAKNIVMFDSKGPIYKGRPALAKEHEWFAQNTNPDNYQGDVQGALSGADIVIGLAAPRILKHDDVACMADDAIVFALSNPDPEIYPEEISDNIAVMATGRSDYPNQINNALVFPGFFQGLLSVGATGLNETMKIAAACAIADLIDVEELSAEYIIPGIFNEKVADAVARSVADSAIASNLSRRRDIDSELGEIR